MVLVCVLQLADGHFGGSPAGEDGGMEEDRGPS